MVPVRKLQLLRDAHATPFAATAAGLGVTTAPPPPSHMAQEPIDQHQEPSKPPPPQESQAGHETSHGVEADAYLAPRLLHPAGHHQEAAGTSGSSNGGSSGNGGAGDWLRLGLAPASPSAGAGSRLAGIFADRAGPPLLLQPRSTEVLPGMGLPPGAFLRPAVPGIPQSSITLPIPRAGPPWMPPWSPAAVAAPPPSLLPFAHRAFYTPGAGSSGLDRIRVVLPAAGVWFVLQAAPHQGREPFLPQIPRSYLRIKDGRVSVRLLIKYLVSKLGLDDASEVEITCRGRPLPPFLTLQHVWDSIWYQEDAVSPSVAPDMSAANHLMVLQYGRRP